VTAAADRKGQVKMRHVGRSFMFDYGEVVIRVHYLSDSQLAWEQVRGPEAGTRAQEHYGSAAVRDDVTFFWWQERDSSVVSQVVDFAQGRVYTSWTSADKKLVGFQGTVTPQE